MLPGLAQRSRCQPHADRKRSSNRDLPHALEIAERNSNHPQAEIDTTRPATQAPSHRRPVPTICLLGTARCAVLGHVSDLAQPQRADAPLGFLLEHCTPERDTQLDHAPETIKASPTARRAWLRQPGGRGRCGRVSGAWGESVRAFSLSATGRARLVLDCFAGRYFVLQQSTILHRSPSEQPNTIQISIKPRPMPRQSSSSALKISSAPMQTTVRESRERSMCRKSPKNATASPRHQEPAPDRTVTRTKTRATRQNAPLASPVTRRRACQSLGPGSTEVRERLKPGDGQQG